MREMRKCVRKCESIRRFSHRYTPHSRPSKSSAALRFRDHTNVVPSEIPSRSASVKTRALPKLPIADQPRAGLIPGRIYQNVISFVHRPHPDQWSSRGNPHCASRAWNRGSARNMSHLGSTGRKTKCTSRTSYARSSHLKAASRSPRVACTSAIA